MTASCRTTLGCQIVYRGALETGGDAGASCVALFDRNGWTGAWKNGVYARHHYHRSAHEVLGVAAGWVRVRLGGEDGQTVELRAATTLGKLRATSRPEPADAFVIAVPTPFNVDRSPNLDYIDAAADAIAPVLASGNVVILESTSPVGATEGLVARLARLRPDLSFPPGRAGQARRECLPRRQHRLCQ